MGSGTNTQRTQLWATKEETVPCALEGLQPRTRLLGQRRRPAHPRAVGSIPQQHQHPRRISDTSPSRLILSTFPHTPAAAVEARARGHTSTERQTPHGQEEGNDANHWRQDTVTSAYVPRMGKATPTKSSEQRGNRKARQETQGMCLSAQCIAQRVA